MFLQLSPQGSRVAVKDDRVIGTVATVSYQDKFSWIGMVLVDPAERGQGVGTHLLHEALEVLRSENSIRLDATPAGHAVYRKFNFIDEYWLSRMETIVSSFVVHERDNPARPMTSEDFPAVLKMDRKVFGADRRVLLEWVVAGAPEYAWIVTRDGQVAGYTCGRHGFDFEHLGPVVAEDRETASLLVTACLSRHRGRQFILDAAQIDPMWKLWLESLGFREQRPFIRMFYRENRWPGLPEKQFAVLGPEFG